MKHAQFVFACGRLRGLTMRLETGGELDDEEIAFLKKFSGDLLIHQQEWIDAMKRQEDDATLAAIHAASWRLE